MPRIASPGTAGSCGLATFSLSVVVPRQYCALRHSSGHTLSLDEVLTASLGNQEPAEAGLRLVDEQVVQQQLRPVAAEANFARGLLQIPTGSREALPVRDDRVNGYRGCRPLAQSGAGGGDARGAHFRHGGRAKRCLVAGTNASRDGMG